MTANSAPQSDETVVVRLAARGDGVTADGRYLPGAVPGDRVVGGDIRPGPHRAAAICKHFGRCGGCQLQHVDEEVLANFVQGRVVGALQSAGVQAEMIAAAHLSPPRSRRRAAMRAETRDGILALGFNEESSRAVVDLQECHVLTPGLFTLAQALRPILSALMPKRWICGVTLTEAAGGADILISNLSPSPEVVRAFSGWKPTIPVARVSVEDGGRTDIVLQRGKPVQTFGGVDVQMPPATFLQATADGEAALVTAALDFTRGAGRVADLFCGLGTFALPLSADAEVVAADAAGPAVKALEAAARGEKRRVRTLHRDLFRRPMTVKELAGYGAVVLDPPRAGAKAQVEGLAASKVPVVAYVSCNPSTFARDASTLVRGGYALTEVRPIGQFRWSTHVELAARFVR